MGREASLAFDHAFALTRTLNGLFLGPRLYLNRSPESEARDCLASLDHYSTTVIHRSPESGALSPGLEANESPKWNQLRSPRKRLEALKTLGSLQQSAVPHVLLMARRANFKDGLPYGLTYRQFLHVNEAFKRLPAASEEAVDRMEMHLCKAKGQDIHLLSALAESWYFLRCAIETVLQGKSRSGEGLPYRIFAEYQRCFHCQSHLDILLAEKEVITTPA